MRTVTSRAIKDEHQGWWWAVWQNGRLVGFGAGYRHKGRCLRCERECAAVAQRIEMPTVECTNSMIQPFDPETN